MRHLVLAILLALASSTAGCAHAAPATGSKGPAARPDPDQPDLRCDLYNTVDCRPPASF